MLDSLRHFFHNLFPDSLSNHDRHAIVFVNLCRDLLMLKRDTITKDGDASHSFVTQVSAKFAVTCFEAVLGLKRGRGCSS